MDINDMANEDARKIRGVLRRIEERLVTSSLPYGIYDEVDGAIALEKWIIENDLRESAASDSTDYILRGLGIDRKIRRAIWSSLHNMEMDHRTIWHKNRKPAVLVGIPSSSIDRDREGMQLMRAIPDICVSISEDEKAYGWSRGRVAFIEFRRIANFGHGLFCDCSEEKRNG